MTNDAAIAHALEVYPQESVGWIKDDVYHRMTNLSEDTKQFYVSHDDELEAFTAGMNWFVHSHPDGTRCPSAADMRYQQVSGVPWQIVVLMPPTKGTPLPQFWEAFEFGDQLPIAPYVGRIFRHGVYDCYSLVRDWWRQEKKITLPLFPRDDEWWRDGKDLILQHLDESGFKRIPEENLKDGDVVLMTVGHFQGKQLVNHLAVYIGNGLIIHHLAGRPSRTDPLHTYRTHHVVGYVRYGGQK